MKIKDQNLLAKVYERVLREQAGFSIADELYKLYTEIDPSARTKSGASVIQSLKFILDELEEIVKTAEMRQGDQPEEVLASLIRNLKLD